MPKQRIATILVSEFCPREQLEDPHAHVLRYVEVLSDPDEPEVLMVHAEWESADGLGSFTEAFRYEVPAGFNVAQQLRLTRLFGENYARFLEIVQEHV